MTRFSLLMAAASVVAVALVSANRVAAASPVAGKLVVIDAGHQRHANHTPEPIGPDSKETKICVTGGTRGNIAGPESEVNLDVALRLHDILSSHGVTVVMVRTTQDVDICNTERAALGNRMKADLVMRIHCNSGSVHGCFTLYPDKIPGWTDDVHEESLRAAKIVQPIFARHVGIPDQGVKPRKDLTGFNWSDRPVILTEMLHMQNADDDQRAADPAFRQILAEGLALGILDYLATVEP